MHTMNIIKPQPHPRVPPYNKLSQMLIDAKQSLAYRATLRVQLDTTNH